MAQISTAPEAPAFKSAHFIGIGGAGMSAIALIMHERGYDITGSDLKTSRYIRQLIRAGIDVRVGHEAKTVDELNPDVVVVSTAIPDTNPEVVRARELGIPVWPRARMLSVLSSFLPQVPDPGMSGIFDNATLNAVRGFERYAGLPVTGSVGRGTWDAILNQFTALAKTVFEDGALFPAGSFMAEGLER